MINDGRIIAKTAMVAGEVMLVSGAEVSRVEDTMNRILSLSEGNHTAYVLATGIMCTMDVGDRLITLSKRVSERATNIGKIYEINAVSRKLAEKSIDILEAFELVSEIKDRKNGKIKSAIKTFFGFIGVSLFFAMLLGGNINDCLVSGICGAIMAIVYIMLTGVGFNNFISNIVSIAVMSMIGILIRRVLDINLDLVIIGSIMPMVPGATFTTGIRDMLNGDYNSGLSRIIEAAVVGVSVAIGVALAFYILN